MQHLFFTLVPVAIGFLLGVLIGILLSRKPKLSGIVLPILSVFNTIPGIVFIGLLVLVWGAQSATVLVALGVYATFPVLKNTYAGLVSVDPQYIEAAKGCGMSAMQSLTQVELPLAMPTIIGGLRMSTVYTVSWAVLASMIGGGGLGDFAIVYGYRAFEWEVTLVATLIIIVLVQAAQFFGNWLSAKIMRR